MRERTQFPLVEGNIYTTNIEKRPRLKYYYVNGRPSSLLRQKPLKVWGCSVSSSLVRSSNGSKDEDLTHLAGVMDWKQCGKCEAHRRLDMFKEGNETCNRCLDRNTRWAEKNREREKKKRDEEKEKQYNKEYAMREIVCLTCGCRVRKC